MHEVELEREEGESDKSDKSYESRKTERCLEMMNEEKNAACVKDYQFVEGDIEASNLFGGGGYGDCTSYGDVEADESKDDESEWDIGHLF